MTTRDERVNALLAADAVRIVWRSEDLTNARVRDVDGIHDVQWTRIGLWHCTCALGSGCDHIGAVNQLTKMHLASEKPLERPKWRTYDFRPHADAHGTIAAPTSVHWIGFQEDLKGIVVLKQARGDAAPQESAQLMFAAISGLCGGRPSPDEIAALPHAMAMQWADEVLKAATALHQLSTNAGGAPIV